MKKIYCVSDQDCFRKNWKSTLSWNQQHRDFFMLWKTDGSEQRNEKFIWMKKHCQRDQNLIEKEKKNVTMKIVATYVWRDVSKKRQHSIDLIFDSKISFSNSSDIDSFSIDATFKKKFKRKTTELKKNKKKPTSLSKNKKKNQKATTFEQKNEESRPCLDETMIMWFRWMFQSKSLLLTTSKWK